MLVIDTEEIALVKLSAAAAAEKARANNEV
jgi:hypothetical protein